MHVLKPRYEIPSRTTFPRKLIPDLYKKTAKSVKAVLSCDLSHGSSADSARAFSFTTDVWTSCKMDPYLSLTVSYVYDHFQLRTFAFENKYFPGTHNAQSILDMLDKSMEEWSLPNTVPIFCVRDNGSNIKAAVKKSVWFDLACFAHTLQLAISDGIRAVDGMENMLTKCRRIVSYHHHRCLAGQRIDQIRRDGQLPELDFVMSCPTRWNSEYAMVDRMLLLKSAVCTDIAAVGDVENLTTAEWKLAEGFVAVCQPLAEATEDSSGEKYPTRSMVIPMIYGIFDKLDKFIAEPMNRGSGVSFARKMVAALKQRFPEYKLAMPDCVCTFLDPRFKSLLFDSHCLEVIQAELEDFTRVLIDSQNYHSSFTTDSNASVPGGDPVSTEAAASPTSTVTSQKSSCSSSATELTSATKSSLWDSLDLLSQRPRSSQTQQPVLFGNAVAQEMKLYLKEPPIERTSCPLTWWAEHAQKFQLLGMLARAFLCVPATQTKSERLNSTSGQICDNTRSRLLTQHVTELTFLHENL
jgi:hypothetical protein